MCDHFGTLCIKRLKQFFKYDVPAGYYLFKVNNRSIRKKCKICSKLTPCFCFPAINFQHVNTGCVCRRRYHRKRITFFIQQWWLKLRMVKLTVLIYVIKGQDGLFIVLQTVRYGCRIYQFQIILLIIYYFYVG